MDVDLVFPSFALPQNEWELILNVAKHCLICLKCCGNARTNEDNLLYDVTNAHSDDPYVQGGVFSNGFTTVISNTVNLKMYCCVQAVTYHILLLTK